MSLFKLTLLFLTIISAISLQLVHRITFHDTPLDISAFRAAELERHNFYRAKHSSPALAFNQTLNDVAQTYASYLSANAKFLHSDGVKKGLYGENLFWAWGSPTYTYPSAGASD